MLITSLLAVFLLAGPSAAQGLDDAFQAARNIVADGPSADLPDVMTIPSAEPVGYGPVKTYGVIINGDSEAHHTGNVDRFYEHLRSHYGIPGDDITVISPHRGYRSDRKGVDYAARTVKAKADANDRLVIYTTGHGMRMNGETHLVLMGDATISETDFAAAFLGNSAARVTYIADQCYSGGFVEALTAGSREVLAISASDAYNTTYCQSFIVPYLEAFADSRNDSNNDGTVDEKEAFATAAKRHRSERGDSQGNAQIRESGPNAPRARPMS